MGFSTLATACASGDDERPESAELVGLLMDAEAQRKREKGRLLAGPPVLRVRPGKRTSVPSALAGESRELGLHCARVARCRCGMGWRAFFPFFGGVGGSLQCGHVLQCACVGYAC